MSHDHRVVVYGGSSCRTSVDPQRLLERHQIPVLNLGHGAGMGARVLTRYALDALRPGDTLIVALEPGLLSGPIEIEPLGSQFALAIGRPDILRDVRGVRWPDALLDLRPGGYHVLTLLGKIILRQPLYRYALSELQVGGWHQVASRRDFRIPPPPQPRLSPAGLELLTLIRDECARNNVRVACTLPWQYCRDEDVADARQGGLRFIRDLSAVLPVLREPSLGVHSVRDHFADTELHPTGEGAALRSDELATAIASWNLWTPAEINALLEAAR